MENVPIPTGHFTFTVKFIFSFSSKYKNVESEEKLNGFKIYLWQMWDLILS